MMKNDKKTSFDKNYTQITSWKEKTYSTGCAKT